MNLLLDIVNVTCFARADQAFGVNNFVHSLDTGYNAEHKEHTAMGLLSVTSDGGAEVELDGANENTPLVNIASNGSGDIELQQKKRVDEGYGMNLNMCSAWTVRIPSRRCTVCFC